ncbi:MAG: hypothetical protein PHV33_13630 [Elusimicrobiales bacterium]|nr:hypothetical protein [Elusimicrobiales bacterium]
MIVINRKFFILAGVTGLALLGLLTFFIKRHAIKEELTSARVLACSGEIGSIDLFYIPYSVRTRTPVSPKQLETIYQGKIHADRQDIISEFCGRMRTVAVGVGFNVGFNARWGVVGYTRKSDRYLSIYGDGSGRCSIGGIVFPCTNEMGVWVEKLFSAQVAPIKSGS